VGGASALSANLVEIFWSAQGEGPEVGRSTLFVRFGECDLRCAWCDSPGTWRPARECRIETSPGVAEFESRPNPISEAVVEEAMDRLAPRPGGFLSLTGGEPLLQPESVSAVARMGRARGLRVHLETHGLHTRALDRVLDDIDVVSMDWKLSSDVSWAKPGESGRSDFGLHHEAFLVAAAERSEVVVKVVVTGNTKADELEHICRRMQALAPGVALVLQPVTPFGRFRETPGAAELLSHLRLCERIHPNLRLIPQTHRVYGAL
jgi:7-carboxy-7-deazaguanine synthase